MSIKFNHSPRRLEDFQYELVAIGDRAVELHPVFEEIADIILEREERMFETRGASSGTYWTPLRASTVRRKAKDPGVVDPFAPLRRTDKLKDSLSKRGAEYSILEVDHESLLIGTDHPAAQYLSDGTRNMPARPPLIIPAKHSREYMQMIKDYVFEGGL